MSKHDATKLGDALLLKFFTHRGRSPAGRSELADEVVANSILKRNKMLCARPAVEEK